MTSATTTVMVKIHYHGFHDQIVKSNWKYRESLRSLIIKEVTDFCYAALSLFISSTMSLPKIPNKSPLWLTILVALPLLASYIIFFPLTVWNDIICFFSIVHYIYRVYTCNTLVPFFHLVKVHISFFFIS